MVLPFALLMVAAACVCAPFFVRLWDRAAGYPLALFFLAAGGALATALPSVERGESLTLSYPWVEDAFGSGITFSFALRVDALGLFFALIALGIGACVFLYSAAYLQKEDGNLSFYWLMTAFTLSVLLLVLADDLILLFLSWELVSMASFMLIGRAPGSSGILGSTRTLILTFTGGLTFLVALGLTINLTGETSLYAVLHSDAWTRRPELGVVVAVLIAISAFTKAAQVPFHFWLPEAMAAATPVSAFLHAAAVVKAGIYVLMRFSAATAHIDAWRHLLIIVGMTTAVLGALFAIQKTDLKKLTAYSTVSHLGWIVATIGVGTPAALAAASVHVLAHALFKSSLFMLIGVIDHQTGSRDIRRLGGLARFMPATCISAAIALASMASLPPFFGFLSKEGMLSAFTDVPGFTEQATTLLLVTAGVGAVLTFTYSARFFFGVFVDKHPGTPQNRTVAEAPARLLIPAALPGFLSLPILCALNPLSHVVTAVASVAYGGSETEQVHVHLWNGVTTPLLISLGVLACGIVGVFYRDALFRDSARYRTHTPSKETPLFPFSGNTVLSLIVNSATAWGRVMARLADTYNPARHLLWPCVTLIVVALSVFLGTKGMDGVALPPRTSGNYQVIDIIPLIIVCTALVGLVRTRSRIHAIMLLGAVGTGVTLQMLILGTPDVALTQFLVEILMTVFMMVVSRKLPRFFHRTTRTHRYWSALLALGMGLVTFLALTTLLGRSGRSELAQWYIDHATEYTGGTNIVSSIIVEFRALDTLGELSVLGMTGVALSAIIYSIPKVRFLPGTRPPLFNAPTLNSAPLRFTFRLAFPLLAILTFALFLRGHSAPGGGFHAGLIAASILAFIYLMNATDRPVTAPNTPFVLIGCGMIIALCTGFLGYTGGGFLYLFHGHYAGQHWTTSLIFDGGIFLAVCGMISMGINGLGGDTRPGRMPEGGVDTPTMVEDDPGLFRELDAEGERLRPDEAAAYAAIEREKHAEAAAQRKKGAQS